MKTFILACFLLLIPAMSFSVTPKYVFDEETCSIMVIPKGTSKPLEYFICIIDNWISIQQMGNKIWCEYYLGFEPNVWLDISDYVDCDKVVPTDKPTWGYLKAIYR
ncbi:MAG: hypothetical protein DRP42_06215 [Tenericutes bacterium]|nr:MAG: hypothetical protein DRP42_06215 [Mycoplasmatota bacterium]